nr:hypothetical protein [Bacteroidales bacterium]
MKLNIERFLGFVLLAVCGVVSVAAQDAVAVGDQITSESSLVSGTEYLVYYVGNGAPGYMKDTGSAYTGKNDDSPTEAAVYVFTSNGDDTWTVQNKYTSKYWGTPTANANTYIGSDTGGSWALNFQSSGNLAPSCNGHSWNRSGSNVHPWSEGTANVNQFQIYAVKEITTITPTASEIYTLNNTNTSRGAMTYDATNSTKWVWSSGKTDATAFDATSTNCQWIFYPTGTDDQYYLYNVGAQKFAVPVTGGTYSGYAWAFSDNAVAVSLIIQSEGIYKIKTVTGDVYAAVSNNYEGPIINYNDVGGNFTITKVADVTTEITTQLNTAVNKLVDNVTPLSAIPEANTDNWYVIRIKTHSTYSDKYVYPASSEIVYGTTNYPLTFDHEFNLRPAIDEVSYYTRIVRDNNNKVYWQMPNGRYLYGANSKFPVSTADESTFSMDYTTDKGIRFWGNSRYAVPYYASSVYFIGETASTGNAYYDVYPINLTTAGLVAWKVVITNASESTQLTCTREDVSGLTAVYNNGTFFLPTDVTPTSSDFSMDGMLSCTVDSENKTVTAEYNPAISILTSEVEVIQGHETTGKGNTQQAL